MVTNLRRPRKLKNLLELTSLTDSFRLLRFYENRRSKSRWLRSFDWTGVLYKPVLRIREILVRIRIRGSVPLKFRSGSSSGSYYRRWKPSRWDPGWTPRILFLRTWYKFFGLKILKLFYTDPDPWPWILSTLDLGFGMEKIASGILDKHPGSTTLVCIMYRRYLYGSGSGISKTCWIYIWIPGSGSMFGTWGSDCRKLRKNNWKSYTGIILNCLKDSVLSLEENSNADFNNTRWCVTLYWQFLNWAVFFSSSSNREMVPVVGKSPDSARRQWSS